MRTKPILVTGSHRSGSTWVGRMIAASSKVAYVHEPFNSNHYSPGIYHIEFDHPFTYITSENEDEYYNPIKKTIMLKYDAISSIMSRNISFTTIKQEFNEWQKYYRMRKENKRTLIKDPLAVFSSEWLSSRFNMQVIVLIRHPAAFIASIKLKNWGFYFRHFLVQEELMNDHLQPFKEKIIEYTDSRPSIIDQGILLWRIINYMILKYQENHDDWMFIRHEDISLDPLKEFSKVFNYLGLEYTGEVREIIFNHSQGVMNQKSGIKRDSRSNILTWKTRLADEEINHIRKNVEDVSRYFYSEEDW